MSRAAQSQLCSLATGWALHTGGHDARPVSGVAQVASQPVPLGKAPVVLAWSRDLKKSLQIQVIGTFWGLECVPSVAVPGRCTGPTFLWHRQGKLFGSVLSPVHPWLGNGREQRSCSGGSDLCWEGWICPHQVGLVGQL